MKSTGHIVARGQVAALAPSTAPDGSPRRQPEVGVGDGERPGDGAPDLVRQLAR